MPRVKYYCSNCMNPIQGALPFLATINPGQTNGTLKQRQRTEHFCKRECIVEFFGDANA